MTTPAPAPAIQADAARYLVETAQMPGDPGDVSMFTATELTGYLARNIEHDYYSGCGDQIRGIYRYDGKGKLTELALKLTSETRPGNDYLDWRYEVFEPDDSRERIIDAEFTVRIDGRA